MINNKFKYLSVLLLGLALVGCGKSEKKEEIIRPVMVLDLKTEGNINNIDFPGIVVANNDTILGFKVPGSISKLNVLAGDYVKKGDIIATLDKSDYMINLEANVKKYDAAKAAYDNMVQQYKRAVVLHNGQAMSDKNFDIVTAQYKASKATLSAAEQGVKNAKNRMEDTKLKAPFDGYIGKRILDEGTVVNAGTPVVSIISQGMPRVDINVAGKDIDKVKNGQNYTFKTNDKEYQLKLVKIGKNTDLLKLTYPATFEFVSKDANDLVIGTTGSVSMELVDKTNNSIEVPLTALFEKDGSCVYLYKDGVVKSQKVKLGELKSGGNVTITEGLTKDDIVVIAGVNTVSEGEKVRILEKTSSTNVGGVL